MSPFAKQLWDIAAPHPHPLGESPFHVPGHQEYRFGPLHHFGGESKKPVFLPTVSPQEIQAELDRIPKPRHIGTPHEL